MSVRSKPVKSSTSLYERIGAGSAITAVVDAFYERVLDDKSLRPYFKRTNLDWLKESQVQFFSQALGGPGDYAGRDMSDAHEHLNIKAKDFDRVAKHLVASLKGAGVDDELVDEVIALITPLKGNIVLFHVLVCFYSLLQSLSIRSEIDTKYPILSEDAL